MLPSHVFFPALLIINQILFFILDKKKSPILPSGLYTVYHYLIQMWMILIFLKTFFLFPARAVCFLSTGFAVILTFLFVFFLIKKREKLKLMLGILFLALMTLFLLQAVSPWQSYAFLPYLLIGPFLIQNRATHENYTEQMEFLVLRSILMMAENIRNMNIYEWIAEDLEYLFPHCITIVCRNHENNLFFVPEALGGIRGYKKSKNLILNNLKGKTFYVPETQEKWSKHARYGAIEPIANGLFEAFYSQIPLATVQIIEQDLKIGRGYRIYFSHDQKCFGQALIFPVHQTVKEKKNLNESILINIYSRLISMAFYQTEMIRVVSESEQRFREFTEFLPETVFEATADGVFIYVNRAGMETTGYDEMDLIRGLKMVDIVVPEDYERFQRNIARRIEGENLEAQEYEILAKNGQRIPFRVHTRALFKKRTLVGFQGVASDITDQKMIEKAMNTQAESLSRSNQELQHFAYMASHDLKEPLRMVSSYLSLLKSRYESVLDESGKDFIGYALDGASRMQQLIDGLLSYSRIQTQGKAFEKTDLNRVLAGVYENLRLRMAETRASIQNDWLPEVMADPIQMTQLFQNLLENAMKFTPKNQRPLIKITCHVQKGFFEIRVKDQGIGIPEDGKERIFELFQRLHTRSEYPGTGIGLALCRRIVERHHGKIRVESEDNQGSCFCFTLPAAFEG